MKLFSIYGTFICGFLLLGGCRTPTEPFQPSGIDITVADASCLQARLTLNSGNFPLPATARLTLDNGHAYTYTLSTSTTTLQLDSLLPGKTYTVTCSLSGGGKQKTLNNLSMRTMDTTSHNWQFETLSFGGATSSYFNDVAIINDTLAYAVGFIFMNDSNGHCIPDAYNIAKWDGKEWMFNRIQVKLTYMDSYMITDQDPITTLYAFNPDDIFFVSRAGGVTRLLNGKQVLLDIPYGHGPGSYKVWGANNNDMYFVGGNGRVVHYKNNSWEVLNTGTNQDFYDIYGATDPVSGKTEVLSVCSQDFPFSTGIYRVEGSTVAPIPITPLENELWSIWFVPNRHYYAVGDGIYEKNQLSDSLWKNKQLDITKKGSDLVRGNNINDVIVVGSFGEILHFNGATWKSYINETGLAEGAYGGTAIKNNLLITTGYNGAVGIITIGRR
jgi:hypothetical protein